MTQARNRKAVARSLRERAAIKRAWLELLRAAPFEPVTGKAISRLLTFKLARSTVYWHMNRIRAEAAAASVDTLESLQYIE